MAKPPSRVLSGLAQYRDLFTTDRYPGFRPLGVRAAVAGGLKTPTENPTAPVPTAILQPMLAAVLYLVDTLGPQAVALTRHKAERETDQSAAWPRSTGYGMLLEAINRRVAAGRPFNRVPMSCARRACWWSPPPPGMRSSERSSWPGCRLPPEQKAPGLIR